MKNLPNSNDAMKMFMLYSLTFQSMCSTIRTFKTSVVKSHTFCCCQSADIMASLCGVRVNNFSKTARPRDMLFFFKATLSIEDEKVFKACKSVCSSVC